MCVRGDGDGEQHTLPRFKEEKNKNTTCLYLISSVLWPDLTGAYYAIFFFLKKGVCIWHNVESVLKLNGWWWIENDDEKKRGQNNKKKCLVCEIIIQDEKNVMVFCFVQIVSDYHRHQHFVFKLSGQRMDHP